MRLAFPALALGLAFSLSACINQPDYRAETAPPEVWPSVDLNSYAGKWYEIARYPNSFERGCQGVTAEYELLEGGKVSVKNTCRKGSPDGKARSIVGKARAVEGSNNAKLKVKFTPGWLPVGEGDYWILHIEPYYAAALVGDPDGKYLWILARRKDVPEETVERLKARAAELGYDAAKLERTPQ